MLCLGYLGLQEMNQIKLLLGTLSVLTKYIIFDYYAVKQHYIV